MAARREALSGRREGDLHRCGEQTRLCLSLCCFYGALHQMLELDRGGGCRGRGSGRLGRCLTGLRGGLQGRPTGGSDESRLTCGGRDDVGDTSGRFEPVRLLVGAELCGHIANCVGGPQCVDASWPQNGGCSCSRGGDMDSGEIGTSLAVTRA